MTASAFRISETPPFGAFINIQHFSTLRGGNKMRNLTGEKVKVKLCRTTPTY